MNKILLYLFLLIPLLHSCEKDGAKDVEVYTLATTNIYNDPNTGLSSATINGELAGDESYVEERGFLVSEGNMFDLIKYSTSLTEKFAFDLADLTKDAIYYVKAYAFVVGRGTLYGEILPFTSSTTPVVSDITEYTSQDFMTATTATISVAMADGGSAITESGIYIGTTLPFTTADKCSGEESSLGFDVSLTGLTPETKYYVLPYAINTNGESAQDEIKEFTTESATLADSKFDDATPFSDVAPTSITINGALTNDGNDPSTKVGVKYGLSSDAMSNKEYATPDNEGKFSITIKSLTSNTEYHFAVFTENAKGENSTASQSQSTPFETVPIVESVALVQGADYVDNAFTLKAKMTNDGGLTATDYGFFVGTTSGSLTKQSVKGETSAAMDGDGNFSYTFTEAITADTKYYYYPYVENAIGLSEYDTESTLTTGVVDKDIYTRDATMAFTTDRLVYWTVDPITVTVDSSSTKLTFLDRNLGATKVPTSSAYDCDAVGNYYVWSAVAPQVSPEMAKLLSNGFVGSSAIPSSGGVAWNGWGAQTYQYTNLDDNGRWSELEDASQNSINPCPEGYRPPTMAEWLAAMSYYNIPVTEASQVPTQLVANLYNSPLKFCLSGNFVPAATVTNVANILIWSDNSTYSGTTPQAKIISTQDKSMSYLNKRENIMPVRCVKSEVVNQ